MYFVDVSEGSGRDPVEDLAALRKEIEAYGQGMEQKPAAVGANKVDALQDRSRLEALQQNAHELGLPCYAVSAATGDGCRLLVQALYHRIMEARTETGVGERACQGAWYVRAVGVLGGTFDPVHLGHLRAAESVRGRPSIWRKFLFIPAATPPHKTDVPVTGADHRYRMLEEALQDESCFRISRIELEREGPSYTIDTLRALRVERPDARYVFIVGSDAFAEIETWKSWEELVAQSSFIVHDRPGGHGDVMDSIPSALKARVRSLSSGIDATDEASVFVAREPMLCVSSTEIRAAVRAERSVRFLVPDSVAGYILKHRLYL